MKLKKAQFIGAFMAAVMSVGVYSAPANVVYADSSKNSASSSAGVDVPSNFTCKTTSSSITLSWDAVDGADAYRVYKYNSSSGKYEKYKNVAGNSCSVTGLKKGTKYKFKVAPLYKSGKRNSYTEGTVSKVVSAVTNKNDIPAAPSADFTGFVSGNGKKYYYSSGKLVTGWQVIDGSNYYFKNDYTMYTGWLNTKDGFRYRFFSLTDGKMAKDVTLKIDGVSYDFDKSGAPSFTPKVIPNMPDKEGFPEYNKLSNAERKAVDDICRFSDDIKNIYPNLSEISFNQVYSYRPNTAAHANRSGYWISIAVDGHADYYFICTEGYDENIKYGLNEGYYYKYYPNNFDYIEDEWSECSLDKAIAEYLKYKYGPEYK